MKRRIPEFILIFLSESPNRKVNSCTPCETSFEPMSVYDLLHLATSPALDRVDKDQWKESSLQGRIHLESTQSCCRQADTDRTLLPNIPALFSTKDTLLGLLGDSEIFSVSVYALFYYRPIPKTQVMLICL